MSHLDILIPFGLPPAEMSADLLRGLNAPSLAVLSARSRSGEDASRNETFDGFHRALPHELWLSRRFGLDSSNSSPPVAAALMGALGLRPLDGTWFVLQPVHIHIARDHLVLTDPKQLLLTEQESRTLFDIAMPLFAENGKELVYGNADIWFVRADDWSELQTATPDATAGRNIDIWMAKGPGERDWRKVQNEVQMHWFNHPINEGREATRRKTINSVWLWGGSAAPKQYPASRYAGAINLRGWMQAFVQYVPRHVSITSAADLQVPGNNLLVLDALIEPALANDWSRWLDHMRELESTWFGPILKGLKSGAFDQASITLTHDTRISGFTTTRSSLRKFWVKPSLATLCP